MVCEKCAKEFKTISKDTKSLNYTCLKFFIKCHLVFIGKRESINIEFLDSYNIGQLQGLAKAMKIVTFGCVLK